MGDWNKKAEIDDKIRLKDKRYLHSCEKNDIFEKELTLKFKRHEDILFISCRWL